MERKEKIERLKKIYKKKLEEKKKQKNKNTVKTITQPRYDEVYWKGLEWLNKL